MQGPVAPYGRVMDTLRDRLGLVIGRIETQPDGRQILRDKYGRRLAEYDPRQNVTRDAHGRRVGTGNQLTRAL